ncbi:MAG: hypothetical protein F6K11_34860 [Leptolyngbya sp. SIO3F4]|nr:hypothetical protein [Leptolyngbya sp. SIO3F4]
MLLIPPGRGRTTIQTPNAVTGIQGSALFVRVRCLAELTAEGYCTSFVTFVAALTNNPTGAMLASNQSGSQQQPIYAGEMVVIEDDRITQKFEFDLKTFYQTSRLVEGLKLDSPTPPPELSNDLQAVWQEIQDALELQGDFDNQGSADEIVENPAFIALNPIEYGVEALNNSNYSRNNAFTNFPSFTSSAAAVFHGPVQQQLARTSEEVTSEPVTNTVLGTLASINGSIDNIITTGDIRREAQINQPPPEAPAPVSVISSATTSSAVSLNSSSNANLPIVSTEASQTAPIIETFIPSPTSSINTVSEDTFESAITSAIDIPAPTEQPSTPTAITAPTTVEQPVTSAVDILTPVEQTSIPTTTELNTNTIESPITPVVDLPSSIEKPEAPVINTSASTEIPTGGPTTLEEIIPPLESDQISERPEVSLEDFEQQPSGASDPEVLQSPDLSINESTPDLEPTLN